jgi:hypothetical protein
MKLKPQKASITKENAAAEERQQETKNKKTDAQSEVEESAKKQTKTEKTAQKQHQAQPEVEPQGFNKTQVPALPGPEDVVRERRMADEFALRWSEEARAAASRSADYMREVAEEAYARIHFAEAVLCGAVLIVPIGRVGPIGSYDKWWTPFKVGNQWFVLRYHDTYVREYELLKADGPTPSDDDEPKRTRKQRRDPPKQVGPRQRRGDDTESKSKASRKDSKGSRAAAAVRKPPRQTEKPRKKDKKKKKDDSKRIVNELERVGVELELRFGEILHHLRQQMRRAEPQLRTNLERINQVGGIELTAWRDAVAPFVQVPRQIALFACSLRSALTRRHEVTIEQFDTTARLESCDAGRGILSRMRLNSWMRDESKLWPPDWFGVRYEEQVCT